MAKTILIADDNQGQIELFQKTFSARGYQVITAKNGDEAYGLALGKRPDLIVMDVCMPKMDGDLVSMYLKSPDSPIKETPIILVTGLRTEQDIVDSQDDNIFAKPVSLEKLLAKVSSLIGPA